MSRRSEALEESIRELEADLAAARAAESYTAVGNMHRLLYKLRTELADARAVEDDEEASDEEILEAICDGISALPDEGVERVAAALEERRKNGRR